MSEQYEVRMCLCDRMAREHARMLYVDLREQPYHAKVCCEGEELYHEIENGQRQDFKAVAYSNKFLTDRSFP
jgi:hypothetical protein